MGSVAASGGYYIAAPAHKIIAHPTTLTGSIGVIAMLPRLAAAQEKYGVHMHTITQSHRRGWFGMTGELSEGDRLLLQVGIERIYDLFTKKVAEGRHLPLEKVLNIAEGRVWTGQQALEIGLVDALGDLDTAFREVKTLAGLNPEASVPVLRWLPKIHALRECFLSPQHMEACTGQEYMPGGVLTVMSYGVGSSLPLLEVLHRVVGQAASLPVWDTLHKPMALWLDAGWSF
jgi:protease-4